MAERVQTDTIVLSIELKSGRFKMALQHPLYVGMSPDEFKDGVETWLDLSMKALALGLVAVDAELSENPKGRGKRGGGDHG